MGKVINKYKVAKHFNLTITKKRFTFEVNEESVQEEASRDGLYVIRTTIPEEEMSEAEAVRSYKQLSVVEQAFRNMKTDALRVRPFYHYAEPRVKAHIFLCMLAYYVRWHMEQALQEYLFVDEDKDEERDPVVPVQPSESAKIKAKTKKLPDETPVHSFETLLDEMSTVVRNTCNYGKTKKSVEITTTQNPYQKRIFKTLETIPQM